MQEGRVRTLTELSMSLMGLGRCSSKSLLSASQHVCLCAHHHGAVNDISWTETRLASTTALPIKARDPGAEAFAWGGYIDGGANELAGVWWV